jgi:hypothetical protein
MPDTTAGPATLQAVIGVNWHRAGLSGRTAKVRSWTRDETTRKRYAYRLGNNGMWEDVRRCRVAGSARGVWD